VSYYLQRDPFEFFRSPVWYELGFNIQEDGILYIQRRENLKSYIALTGWDL
jgi:hypothetical protein